MSLLFKHLRIHQVFGANTDVGKTIITAALVRASAAEQHRVFYLKPVSTGPMQDADDEHVKRYVGGHSSLVQAHCLYRFEEPLSPHLAAKMAAEKDGLLHAPVPSDATFVTSVASYIRRCASAFSEKAHMYVETAGGVHSPTLSGTTQVDSYRPLFLPTMLVGDSKLGGISSTIASFEALLLRGYIVDSVLLFKDEYYRNWEYLASYFAERGVKVSAFKPPPPREDDLAKNFTVTEEYYRTLVPKNKTGGLFDVLRHLDERHAARLADLKTMPSRTLDTIWWPFVQHGHVKGPKDVNVIDSAWGDFFTVYNGHAQSSVTATVPASDSVLQPQFDGSASWWTQALGHAHPSLTLAAARAAGRYGHVMFPEATHLPALKLAERLVKDGPGKGWASRAFISDNGSTGMEVALKMALRAYNVRHGEGLAPARKKGMGVLGLKGSYHGDTIGAMDACEEGVYTCEWHQAKGYWFDPPTVSIRQCKVFVTLPPAMNSHDPDIEVDSVASAYDVPSRMDSPLATLYRNFIQETLQKLAAAGGPPLGALVLEPLVMGAGGMIFVDPLFQRIMIDVVRGSNSSPSGWSGVPVIFDEVFVGLFRIGMLSTAPLLGVTPDISVHAKILTGGLVPLAATLASDSIFQAFVSDNKVDALLHGHSYTAHAVGCEVANETMDIVERLAEGDTWTDAQDAWRAVTPERTELSVWSFWNPGFVDAMSRLDIVSEVMTLGTVVAIKLKDDHAGYQSASAQAVLRALNSSVNRGEGTVAPGGAPFSVHFRTLGNVAYFMTSLNTPAATVRSVEDRIWAVLDGKVQG
ncbi:PLP-dependent transferase [Artomyces pyxidatus]|uniref:PLP-dependent transferase n=1 Tax=Artomyces pyxidatus TaxID=48021 RepID=A0ACB8TG31_9AGAM|nr:PLP-dependent transferase [Artomyces pyxidatus]